MLRADFNNTSSTTQTVLTMDYPIPKGLHAVPADQLDTRADAEVDKDLITPKPVTSEKNVWFFWHSGFLRMHPYTQRNVRAWHRRFSRHGWTIRVLDRLPGSPLNIAEYLDINDPGTFPQAFREGTIGGDYAPQHTSDLVRWPLLLKYGGVYADAGMLQIGDLDRLWNATVGNPDSPFEVLSYNFGSSKEFGLTNYFLCSGKNNALFERCHRLLLALWASDGGKTSTEGLHASPLLKGLPLINENAHMAFEDNGRKYSDREAAEMLTDYIIQGHAMSMVMGLVDEEDGWNGPEYIRKHVYAIEFMVGAQLINEYTAWNGTRAYNLMSLPLPKQGESESEDQKAAREIVEGCLSRSFGFKLATGMIIKVMGDTLSSLWRKNEGSDDIPGTYAHWFRYGVANLNQDEIPPNVPFEEIPPVKRGPLLSESL